MEVALADRLNGIGEYYFSQKLREIDERNKRGEDVINLGIGSPDLAPHSTVLQELHAQSSKQNVHGYQNYKGSPILRTAIANWYKKWYGVELNADKEILPLIGSKEGIMHVCMTYINPGDVVLVPNPGYPTYSSAAKLAGGHVQEYPLTEKNNWLIDFEELENIITQLRAEKKKVKLMFVNYPHMPTGATADDVFFEKLVDFAKTHSILICHDNPYSFILNDAPQSLLAIEGAKDVVIELNSLSKSHNMAGWRVGMLCGAEERINEVLRFKSNMDSGMFLPVQLAAASALELGNDWHDVLNKIYTERREKVFDLLDSIDCTYNKHQTGLFVWARIPAVYETGYQLSDEVLNEAAVFITPGGIFGSQGNGYVRISLCSTAQKIAEATKRIVESKTKQQA